MQGKLAFEGSRTGYDIACRLRPVQLELYSRISALVCARKGDVARVEGTGAARQVFSRRSGDILAITASCHTAGLDVDLGAFHVKLRTWVAGGTVQGDELRSQKVSERYC
jgi:hypothetical protein